MNINPTHPPQSRLLKKTNQISCPIIPDPNNENESEVELFRITPSLPESCNGELLYGTSQVKERSMLEPLSASAHLLTDDPNLMLQLCEQASINGVPDAGVQDFNYESSNSQLKSYISSIEVLIFCRVFAVKSVRLILSIFF